MDKKKVSKIHTNKDLKNKLLKCKITAALSCLASATGVGIAVYAIFNDGTPLEMSLFAAPALTTGGVAGLINSLEEYEYIKRKIDLNEKKGKIR